MKQKGSATNRRLQCQSQFTIPFHESLDIALSIVARLLLPKDILKKKKHNIGNLKKDKAGF